jgi:putative membrane protein
MLENLPEQLVGGTITAVVYGVIGILLVLGGFKVFDALTPKLDIQKELAENKNVAVAIVCSAVILGICYIVASVVN